jgi:hypothetical protein
MREQSFDAFVARSFLCGTRAPEDEEMRSATRVIRACVVVGRFI